MHERGASSALAKDADGHFRKSVGMTVDSAVTSLHAALNFAVLKLSSVNLVMYSYTTEMAPSIE